MEHSSRMEKHQRKRSRTRRKNKRRLMTSALILAFFSLAFILWFSYNGGKNEMASPEETGTKQGAGQSPGQPAGQSPDSGSKPGTGAKAPNSPATSGGTPAAPSNNASPGNAGNPATGGGSANTNADAIMEDPSRVQLAFVGDVMFAENVAVALKANGYDYPYKLVKPYLEKADLTIANLESPISERGEPETKQYAYRSSPLALPAFKEAGFDLVNLANNHILDYGKIALLDTFEHLDKHSIRWFGAGRDTAEAFKPVIVEKKGIKIAFLGLSRFVPSNDWKAGKKHPGVADAYATKLPVEAIQKAKKMADLVVVVTHWGVERQDKPEKYQHDLAKLFIDEGADLVVGGHPHVLQGFEQYKGKWIAYSLGNFIFTMNENPKTWESMVLQASCSKTDCALKAVPVLTKLANPEPMKDEEARKLLERLTSISFGAELDPSGHVRIAR